jgi:hypothetical protein
MLVCCPALKIEPLFYQVVARQGLPFPVYVDETAVLLALRVFLRHLGRMKRGAVKYSKLKE